MQPSDPWGFDNEPVETWADILGTQAWDLVCLSAFLVLAVLLTAVGLLRRPRSVRSPNPPWPF